MLIPQQCERVSLGADYTIKSINGAGEHITAEQCDTIADTALVDHVVIACKYRECNISAYAAVKILTEALQDSCECGIVYGGDA
eukprot:13494-Heterococcus_DN1.PRE.2